VGVVGVDGLDLDCMKEKSESVNCFSPDEAVLLVVAEGDARCLVRCG